MLDGLEGILRLAEAGAIELGRASDLATDSLGAMGLEVSELNDYLDVVAATSTSANTSIEQLMEAIIVAGPVAKQLSIEKESLAAALAKLADKGTKGSEAGKALSSILSRLAKPTKDVQKALDKLNVELFNSKGEFRGLEAVMGDMNKAFSSLSEEQKLQYATSLAGKNYLSQFLNLVDSADGSLQDYASSLYNVDDEATLSIERLGQKVTITIVYKEKTYTQEYLDFPLTAKDSKYMYIGMFANRGTTIEFTDVSFEITGDAIEA